MRLSEKFKRVSRGIGSGVLALSLSAGLAGVAHAYTFDPDGTFGTTGDLNISALDWGPSSFLALGGVTAINNFNATSDTCPALSNCSFDVITHAKLVGITSATTGNNLIPGTFTGDTPTFEMTMVARFSENVTKVDGNTASFTVDTSKAMYVEIYFDTTPDAVAVSGSGFTDGRLILKGTLLLNSDGTFAVTSFSPTVALDQAVGDGNINDYCPGVDPCAAGAGQQSVTGNGDQGNLTVGGLTIDGTFFKQALASFGLQFANASLNLPFVTVDPSDCFADYAAATGSGTAITGTNTSDCDTLHVDDVMSAQTTGGGFRPFIGPVNGILIAGVNNTDFMAQTDFNSPLTAAAVVPEPASFLLLGAGLLGMGGYARRRNRKSK